MTVHSIQNPCVIVKHIRYTSIKTCCTKSLPHHTSQIGTTIITALTMVIRIEPNCCNQFSGGGWIISCNGICERFKAKKIPYVSSRYAQWQKRCSVCEIFIIWEDSPYRPCCSYKLRTRSLRGFGMSREKREKLLKRYQTYWLRTDNCASVRMNQNMNMNMYPSRIQGLCSLLIVFWS